MPPRISTSNLHEPTPQVAAKDVADSLHLHVMDTDLQIDPLISETPGFSVLSFQLTERKTQSGEGSPVALVRKGHVTLLLTFHGLQVNSSLDST